MSIRTIHHWSNTNFSINIQLFFSSTTSSVSSKGELSSSYGLFSSSEEFGAEIDGDGDSIFSFFLMVK